MSLLADLLIGIFDFVIDVLLFRRLRRGHGSRERSVAEDTFAIAHFNFGTLLLIGVVSAGLMLLLALGFGLSAGVSVGVGIAVGVVWGLWRYLRMVRED
ncbi:hypothetical protein K4L06_15065 [Lysobacter sp. BMK333-48F3]|uniref:hypothetical protein n=1 Tax=Lysobacter sp. BMK333-48F3 TaxID=2867962 RepID=UPI001C8B8B66|nr:hypothetical protein [Lysobacter sp. BMK333-48F3]MBX9402629.1 hypothetical protein [Lysobacter sp. BMK333-48F3]